MNIIPSADSYSPSSYDPCNGTSEAAVQRCSLKNRVLKICNKVTGEHPYTSMISIKLLCNFTEIMLWHGCSPVILSICFIFSEHLFPRTILDGCFWYLDPFSKLWQFHLLHVIFCNRYKNTGSNLKLPSVFFLKQQLCFYYFLKPHQFLHLYGGFPMDANNC